MERAWEHAFKLTRRKIVHIAASSSSSLAIYLVVSSHALMPFPISKRIINHFPLPPCSSYSSYPSFSSSSSSGRSSIASAFSMAAISSADADARFAPW